MQTTKLRVEAEEISAVKKKLKITVPAEAVTVEMNNAFRALRSNAVVAGFRKGAVPVNILKAKFGDRVQEDVISRLIETSYPEALRDNGLIPVDRPHIELVTVLAEEGKEFAYSATVEVTPKVEVEGYRGMELNKEKIEVSEKDVEEGLKRLQESRAQFKEVDRAAKEGDLAVVDFEGFIGGEPIKGGKASEYPIIVGEKTLLPGFDEALMGGAKGDEKEAPIKFPDGYNDKSLAGKDAVFTIKVKAVKEKELPALDDEFAKDVECESLDALKERVKSDIRIYKENNEKERLKNEILDRLAASYEFEIPESMVNRYVAMILNRVIENMRQGVFAPEDRDLSSEQLKEKYKEVAKKHAKEDIILDTIAAKENMQVSEDEMQKAIRNLAASRRESYESLLAKINKENAMELIRDGMKHEKVFDLIIEESKAA